MFKPKKIVLAVIFTAMASLILKPVLIYAENEPLKVVASQALYADLVKQIGKNHVDVKFIASPKFNVHFIEPKPSDVRNLAKADLYVFNGLDLEAWSDSLVEAAGKPKFFRGGKACVDLSKDIRLLKVPSGDLSRSMGDLHLFGNPHYSMNPENARSMVRALADALKSADAVNADDYEKNAESFLVRLDQKLAEWKSLCAHCAGKEIYSYHDDIAYLADFLGFGAEYFIEPKPGIPPSPKHLEFLEANAKKVGVKAIILPTYYSRQISESLGKRAGIPVVTIAHNVSEVPEASDFFSLFDYNVRHIAEALK